MGKYVGKISLIFCLLFLLIAFQNCIEATVEFNSDPTNSSDDFESITPPTNEDLDESSGNGEGYGGRTDGVGQYLVYNYTTPCTNPDDPTPHITDIIEEENGEFILLKENCQIIQPTIVTDRVSLSADETELVFDNTTFERDPIETGDPTPPGVGEMISFFCQGNMTYTSPTNPSNTVEYKVYIKEPTAEGVSRKFRFETIERNSGGDIVGSTFKERNTDHDIIITSTTRTWNFNDNSGEFEFKVEATNGSPDQYRIGDLTGTILNGEAATSPLGTSCTYTPPPN